MTLKELRKRKRDLELITILVKKFHRIPRNVKPTGSRGPIKGARCDQALAKTQHRIMQFPIEKVTRRCIVLHITAGRLNSIGLDCPIIGTPPPGHVYASRSPHMCPTSQPDKKSRTEGLQGKKSPVPKDCRAKLQTQDTSWNFCLNFCNTRQDNYGTTPRRQA